MLSCLANGQIIGLAVDRYERSEIWIELVQANVTATKRTNLAGAGDEADTAVEKLLCDLRDLLSVGCDDDLWQRHGT